MVSVYINDSRYTGKDISIDGDVLTVDGIRVFISNTRTIKNSIIIDIDSECKINIANAGDCSIEFRPNEI